MITKEALRFLSQLKKNNNKPWFDVHRPDYERTKKELELFTQQLIDTHGKKDPGIAALTAKACMFRINRDVRFSKNKDPYKTNMGAFINQGGKKSFLAGYYFHLEPGASFVGGGLYMPMPEHLSKVRQEIDYNLDAFKKILKAAPFKKIYGDLDRSEEYTLSRVPKGYEADNPAAEYLKLKSFVGIHYIDDKTITSPQLLKEVLAAFAALQPLIEFVNEGLE